MRKKVLVTYSVKYIKEVELEVTEEINEKLDEGKIINWDLYDNEYNMLSTQDECFNLPIPTICVTEIPLENTEVEYIDGSFEIESFEI